MLNKISNETLQNFFERKTNLKTAQITRIFGQATIIMEDINRNPYVTFEVTDKHCKAYPKERLGNMNEIWAEFLNEQKEIQKQFYLSNKVKDAGVGVSE